MSTAVRFETAGFTLIGRDREATITEAKEQYVLGHITVNQLGFIVEQALVARFERIAEA